MKRMSPVLVLSSFALAVASCAGRAPALEPIPGLSRTTFGALEEAVEPILKEPFRAVPEELLADICTVSDLVAVTFSDEHRLSTSAFELLRRRFNSKVTGSHIQRLLLHLSASNKDVSWKATGAVSVMGANKDHGIPALLSILEDPPSRLAQVHAAAGLTYWNHALKGESLRRAQEVLLRALANDDDSSRVACNSIQPLRPWMIRRLLDRLKQPEVPPNLRKYGVSLLSGCDPTGFEEELRELFLKTVRCSPRWLRISALYGLWKLGLRESDEALLEALRKDEDDVVRARTYSALARSNQAWAIPMLLDGLKDPDPYCVRNCVEGVHLMKHRPAVPLLIDVLRRTPQAADERLPDVCRKTAEVITQLAGLEGYDFEFHAWCGVGESAEGLARIARMVRERDAHLRREAHRLLRWWDAEGKSVKWGTRDE